MKSAKLFRGWLQLHSHAYRATLPSAAATVANNMSEYDDRPSKRRRRDSISQSPPRTSYENERRSEKRHRDRYLEDEKRSRQRSRDRSFKEIHQRVQDLLSPDRDQRPRHRSERRPRSRSRSKSHEPNKDSERDYRSIQDRNRDRNRSSSPRRDRRRDRSRDRSRDRDSRRDRDRDRNTRPSRSPKPFKRSKAPLPSQNDAFTSTTNPTSALDKPIEKQKPNFGLTGKLAAASKTVQTANQTIVLKYHEPPEARKPPARDQWRLYVFKGDEILETVELAEQSCWLIGRETAVADFPIEHPSCSKQHAMIQFRYLEKRNEFGDKIGKVKPYVIDLESANGTNLNEDPIPAAKYVELRDKDVLKFGHSSREYVIQLPKTN